MALIREFGNAGRMPQKEAARADEPTQSRPQCSPGIRSGRMAGRKERCREPDSRRGREHACQGRRVPGRHPVEKAGSNAQGTQSQRDARGDSSGNQHERSADDHEQYLAWFCTDRNSYPDLTRSLSHREADQAVDADRGDGQRGGEREIPECARSV